MANVLSVDLLKSTQGSNSLTNGGGSSSTINSFDAKLAKTSIFAMGGANYMTGGSPTSSTDPTASTGTTNTANSSEVSDDKAEEQGNKKGFSLTGAKSETKSAIGGMSSLKGQTSKINESANVAKANVNVFATMANKVKETCAQATAKEKTNQAQIASNNAAAEALNQETEAKQTEMNTLIEKSKDATPVAAKPVEQSKNGDNSSTLLTSNKESTSKTTSNTDDNKSQIESLQSTIGSNNSQISSYSSANNILTTNTQSAFTKALSQARQGNGQVATKVAADKKTHETALVINKSSQITKETGGVVSGLGTLGFGIGKAMVATGWGAGAGAAISEACTSYVMPAGAAVTTTGEIGETASNAAAGHAKAAISSGTAAANGITSAATTVASYKKPQTTVDPSPSSTK